MTDSLNDRLQRDLAAQITEAAETAAARQELADLLGVSVVELPPDEDLHRLADAMNSPDPQAALRRLAGIHP